MSSSEIKDSVKFSGHRSNFSQTCSKLSQYLKERGSFGDLNLGLSPNFQQQHGISSPTTKNLLPMIEKAGQKMDTPTRVVEPERSQMTIFYGGQVIVINDFPGDKAKEIMGMASKIGSQNPNMLQKPNESSFNGPWNNLIQQSSQTHSHPLSNDMPIMRNASLAKFFEKRKDRITARAPYQVRSKAGETSKQDDNKTWLGLAAQSSHQQNGRQL